MTRHQTFVRIAPDCPVSAGGPVRAHVKHQRPTAAPYTFTHRDLTVALHRARRMRDHPALSVADSHAIQRHPRAAAQVTRAGPGGTIANVGAGTVTHARLAADRSSTQNHGMRTKR